MNYPSNQDSSKTFEPWWVKQERLQREALKREHEEMDRKWKEMGGRPYTDFPPPERSQRSDNPSNW